MRILSYLVYAVLYEGMTIGGTGYAVFVLGHSGWWWLLGTLFSAAIYSPERWSALWDGAIAEKYREQKEKSDSDK